LASGEKSLKKGGRKGVEVKWGYWEGQVDRFQERKKLIGGF